VIALGTFRGRGRDSGVAVDSSAGWVARCSDGLIAEFRTYPKRDQALKAVDSLSRPS
jgi:hypothetical protein